MAYRTYSRTGSTSTTSTSSTSSTSTSSTSSTGMTGMGGGGMGDACFVYPASPATPGKVTPNVVFKRTVFMDGQITMDDGRVVPIWGFVDPDDTSGGMPGMGGMNGGNRPFPSPAIRVREGQIVHTILNVGMMNGVHTIHHHGIEPSTMNDGVGHISFDVSGSYTYQWRPKNAGTYFYHCHVNTVLHAELGMYGALIVDPPPNSTGKIPVFRNGPTYDVETVWACDEIDSRWHSLDWTAGTCGADVGLNRLNPNYFIITGVDGKNSALTAPGIAVTMQRGQTLLARYINAGYLPQRITFGGLTATVVSSDGRPLPRAVTATKLETVSAERYDCIFKPTTPGVYTITVEYLHWIKGTVVGTAKTRVTVT